MNCRLTVVVPCFNQATYLSEAILSILHQTYTNWKCIIINDGSTDDTEEIAIQWCQKDPRIQYFKQQNRGVSSARNIGIAKANSEFILPLDADDKIHKDYIRDAISVFDQYPDTALVYADAEYFGAVNGFWELPDYSYQSLLLRNLIYCSAVFRKEDWERAGHYDEGLKNGWEDWEFWIRLLNGEKEVRKIHDVRFYYRQRNSSMLQNLLVDELQSRTKENYIFRKNMLVYERYFGSMIENLTQNFKLKTENKRLKNSFAFKMSYPFIRLFKRVM